MGSMTSRFLMVGLIVVVLWGALASGVVVLDPGYQAEVYATYSFSYDDISRAEGIAADSQGNLYIAHIGGSIYRIAPNGAATEWVTGLSQPEHLVWGGGTAYGDYLYCTEMVRPGAGRVTRIDSNGVRQTFSYHNNQPSPIAIDRTGTYGGFMYTGTRGNDHIDRIFPNGNTQSFSAFPYNVSGGPESIAFDSGYEYGGLMYVSTYAKTSPNRSGIFSMDAAGNPTRFAPDVVAANHIEIDSFGLFDGDMFAMAMVDDFGSTWQMYHISNDGQAALFLDGNINVFTFGPDGAMYVAQRERNNMVISRITLIPEPATFMLAGLGILIVRRRCSKS